MAEPLRTLLVDTTDEARLGRIQHRLRASRDSFTARWGVHLAFVAGFLTVVSWNLLHSPPLEKQCVVIIRPSQPVEIIGDSC